jgi:hypothetical protein
MTHISTKLTPLPRLVIEHCTTTDSLATGEFVLATGEFVLATNESVLATAGESVC